METKFPYRKILLFVNITVFQGFKILEQREKEWPDLWSHPFFMWTCIHSQVLSSEAIKAASLIVL